MPGGVRAVHDHREESGETGGTDQCPGVPGGGDGCARHARRAQGREGGPYVGEGHDASGTQQIGERPFLVRRDGPDRATAGGVVRLARWEVKAASGEEGHRTVVPGPSVDESTVLGVRVEGRLCPAVGSQSVEAGVEGDLPRRRVHDGGVEQNTVGVEDDTLRRRTARASAVHQATDVSGRLKAVCCGPPSATLMAPVSAARPKTS